MWYCYLLSIQKNGNKQNSSVSDEENPKLNAQIISKCYQNQLKTEDFSYQFPIILAKNILQPTQINQKELHTLPEMKSNSQTQKNNTFKLQCPKTQAYKSEKKFKKSIKAKEQDHLKGKNPGRNSTSNIFRVFLKLCTKPKIQSLIKQRFSQVTKKFSMSISYQFFKKNLKDISPSTSNYINIKQFKKIWQGQSQFNKIFRCLFHWFLNSYAISHSLTLRGKHKMLKESIQYFLSNMHSVEQQIFGQEIQEQQQDDENTLKSGSVQ